MKTFPFGLKNGIAFGFKSLLLFKTVLVEHEIVLEFEPALLNESDEEEKGTAFGFKLLFATTFKEDFHILILSEIFLISSEV